MSFDFGIAARSWKGLRGAAQLVGIRIN